MSRPARALLLLAWPLLALSLIAQQPPAEPGPAPRARSLDWPEPDQDSIDYLANLDIRSLWPRQPAGRPEVAAWLHRSGAAGKVKQIACAPDGRTLATADCSGTVTLWELPSGRLLRRCREDWGPVQMLWFSPDSQHLAASGSPSFVVEIWEAKTGVPAKIDRSVPFFTFGPDGGVAAHLGSLLFRGERRLALGQFERVVVAPDGSAVAVSTKNEVTISSASDVLEGKKPVKLALDERVASIAFSSHGRTLTVLSGDRVTVWQTDGGNPLLSFRHPLQRAMALAPDGRTLAVANWDQSVDFIDVFTRKEQRWLEPGSGSSFRCLVWAPDLRFLIGYEPLWKCMQVRDLRDVAELQAIRHRAGGLTVWEVEQLWKQLADASPERAYPAIWQLASAPENTLAFFRGFLTPRPHKNKDLGLVVPKLLRQLDSDQFDVRQKASAELEKLGPSVIPILRQALAKNPSVEVQRRVEDILKVFDTPANCRDRLLEARTVEVLELIDTPPAWAWLKSLAEGDPNATLTMEAQAALSRRGARSARTPLPITPAFELLPVPRIAN